MGVTKISKGVYDYKGYRISNCGYHAPDKCVWWEAVNYITGCADYHATTKKEIIKMIDKATRKRELAIEIGSSYGKQIGYAYVLEQ